jgi:hypothetical protein
VPETARTELQHIVDEITGYQRRTRPYRWGVAALAVVAVALSVVVFFVNRHDSAAQDSATNRLYQSQLDNCAKTNTARTQDEQLWTTFIALLEGPHPSAHVRNVGARFLDKVKVKDAQVSCLKAYPHP